MPDPTVSLARLIVAILVITGFFVVVWAVLYYGVKTEVKDIIILLIGALLGSYKDVTNFLFSSSAGSADKDKTIAQLAKSGPPQ